MVSKDLRDSRVPQVIEDSRVLRDTKDHKD
jgi:hypothetical protein